jgi:hypothetical protein
VQRAVFSPFSRSSSHFTAESIFPPLNTISVHQEASLHRLIVIFLRCISFVNLLIDLFPPLCEKKLPLFQKKRRLWSFFSPLSGKKYPTVFDF